MEWISRWSATIKNTLLHLFDVSRKIMKGTKMLTNVCALTTNFFVPHLWNLLKNKSFLLVHRRLHLLRTHIFHHFCWQKKIQIFYVGERKSCNLVAKWRQNDIIKMGPIKLSYLTRKQWDYCVLFCLWEEKTIHAYHSFQTLNIISCANISLQKQAFG